MDLQTCHEICSRFLEDVESLGPEYSCECAICTQNDEEPVTAKVRTRSAAELIRLLAAHLYSTAIHMGWDEEQVLRFALAAAHLAISDLPGPPESPPGLLS